MSRNIDWGVIATKSHTLGGVPFGNVNSFVDMGDGHLYFYVSPWDTSMQDVAADSHVSFTISEAMSGKCVSSSANASVAPDPEDPTCARLTYTGTMRKVEASKKDAVQAAMFARHPQMKSWPSGHSWFFATIDLTSDLWLIDFYGGAAMITPTDYYAVPSIAPTKGSEQMGPPHGPNNTAFCPVTGANVTIRSTTPYLALKNGQRLYFSSSSAASTYREKPRDFWLAPHDMPLPGSDGMRGLPDVRGQNMRCPRSNESLTVTMQTPRVVQQHGQAVYFCCWGCVTAFWEHPEAYFA